MKIDLNQVVSQHAYVRVEFQNPDGYMQVSPVRLNGLEPIGRAVDLLMRSRVRIVVDQSIVIDASIVELAAAYIRESYLVPAAEAKKVLAQLAADNPPAPAQES